MDGSDGEEGDDRWLIEKKVMIAMLYIIDMDVFDCFSPVQDPTDLPP